MRYSLITMVSIELSTPRKLKMKDVVPILRELHLFNQSSTWASLVLGTVLDTGLPGEGQASAPRSPLQDRETHCVAGGNGRPRSGLSKRDGQRWGQGGLLGRDSTSGWT